MAHEYIRTHKEGDAVPRGWSLVTFQKDDDDTGGTYEVYEPLATQLRNLISKGHVREARTLFFWFDTGG